jgi:hypothetical protein
VAAGEATVVATAVVTAAEALATVGVVAPVVVAAEAIAAVDVAGEDEAAPGMMTVRDGDRREFLLAS